MNNFKELENEFRGDDQMFREIHKNVSNQQGLFKLFSDVAELFLPNTANTFFKMLGSDEDVVKPKTPKFRSSETPGNIPGGRG
jgi:hypothetical protein